MLIMDNGYYGICTWNIGSVWERSPHIQPISFSKYLLPGTVRDLGKMDLSDLWDTFYLPKAMHESTMPILARAISTDVH